MSVRWITSCFTSHRPDSASASATPSLFSCTSTPPPTLSFTAGFRTMKSLSSPIFTLMYMSTGSPLARLLLCSMAVCLARSCRLATSTPHTSHTCRPSECLAAWLSREVLFLNRMLHVSHTYCGRWRWVFMCSTLRHSPIVYVPLVGVEPGGLCEGRVAQVAHVGPLSCVHPDVGPQVGYLFETHPAQRTEVYTFWDRCFLILAFLLLILILTHSPNSRLLPSLSFRTCRLPLALCLFPFAEDTRPVTLPSWLVLLSFHSISEVPSGERCSSTASEYPPKGSNTSSWQFVLKMHSMDSASHGCIISPSTSLHISSSRPTESMSHSCTSSTIPTPGYSAPWPSKTFSDRMFGDRFPSKAESLSFKKLESEMLAVDGCGESASTMMSLFFSAGGNTMKKPLPSSPCVSSTVPFSSASLTWAGSTSLPLASKLYFRLDARFSFSLCCESVSGEEEILLSNGLLASGDIQDAGLRGCLGGVAGVPCSAYFTAGCSGVSWGEGASVPPDSASQSLSCLSVSSDGCDGWVIVFVVVNFAVQRQTGQAGELLATLLTLKWAQLEVDGHVCLQCHLLPEWHATLTTLVPPLASVNHAVVLESGGCGEGLATLLTLVWLLPGIFKVTQPSTKAATPRKARGGQVLMGMFYT
ncbi:hypothetical protein E2C01_001537 [Portunus trituberculatus]|uniref:Uncharacterized protein n=1 Tax=Portunus trituberculatus TaxID=210409 RepID=A0A5B7CHW2_PORTR|nr:hypothetical protein [Portunus trituberculatus]